MRLLRLAFIFVLLFTFSVASASAYQQTTTENIEDIQGTVVLTHIDYADRQTHVTFAELNTETERYVLDIPFEQARTLRNQVVNASGTLVQTPQYAPTLANKRYLQPTTLTLAPPSRVNASNTLSILPPSRSFILIPCGFSELSEFTPPASDFATQYFYPDNPSISLNSYFEEMSYDQFDLTGSGVHGTWTLLNNSRSTYFIDGSTFATDQYWQDCVDQVDANINFSQYDSITLVSNEESYEGAYATGKYITTDETGTQLFNTVYISSGSNFAGLHAHEMGHTLGLPHVGGYSIYDSQWTAMSGPGNSAYYFDTSTYDSTVAHAAGFTGFGLDLLEWIPTGRIVTVADGAVQDVTFERLRQPTSSTSTLLVKVPVAGSDTVYYVDIRELGVGFDQNIPGSGVTIVEAPVSGTFNPGARIIDNDSNSDPNDAGSYFVPGETFSANGVTIDILSRNGSFYTIRVNNNGTIAYPDVTGDNIVSPVDAIYVINRIGQPVGNAGNDIADVNRDGTINAQDVTLVIEALGTTTSTS